MLRVPVDLNRLVEALMDAGRIGSACEDQRVVEEAVADLLDEFTKTEARDARRRAARGIFRP